jgi:CBS domain-containing protein
MLMNVGELCKREVVSVQRETGLVEAAQRMRERHVGSLVVVAEQFGQCIPIGMLTDRDIVVAVVAKGVDANTLTVGDVMSSGALVVREQDSLMDALGAMREKGVRRMPVVTAAGTLAGILTLDDLLEFVAQEMSVFAHTMRSERARESRVRR